jgi:Spy/CpxP family protein refolding chaperone
LKLSAKSAIVTLVLGFFAGVAGMALGHQIFSGERGDHSLHELVHHELDLTPKQEEALDALEAAFAERRHALEAEMRQANAELAAAIRSSETAGPDVEAAVHHFHDAMGALQTETIDHVFAMRRVLRPDQRARFDETIEQALTTGEP